MAIITLFVLFVQNWTTQCQFKIFCEFHKSKNSSSQVTSTYKHSVYLNEHPLHRNQANAIILLIKCRYQNIPLLLVDSVEKKKEPENKYWKSCEKYDILITKKMYPQNTLIISITMHCMQTEPPPFDLPSNVVVMTYLLFL